MAEVKHTPLPWKSFAPKFKAGRGIGPSSSWIVARTTPCRDGQGQHHSKANAAFIVRACNEYYQNKMIIDELSAELHNLYLATRRLLTNAQKEKMESAVISHLADILEKSKGAA